MCSYILHHYHNSTPFTTKLIFLNVNLLVKFEISPSFVLRPTDRTDIRMSLNVIALNVPLNVLPLPGSLLADAAEESPISLFVRFV